jgi:hypothetical protein
MDTFRPFDSQGLQYDILGGKAALFSYPATEFVRLPQLLTTHKPIQVTPRPGRTSQIHANFD